MNYYEITTTYKEPVEATDEMKSVKKNFLVKAVSVTDAEATIIDWAPGNYSEFNVESVKLVKINQVNHDGSSERYFITKVLDDLDGRAAKPITNIIIYEAKDIKDAIDKAEKEWGGAEIDEVKKYKPIIDQDLCDS